MYDHQPTYFTNLKTKTSAPSLAYLICPYLDWCSLWFMPYLNPTTQLFGLEELGFLSFLPSPPPNLTVDEMSKLKQSRVWENKFEGISKWCKRLLIIYFLAHKRLSIFSYSHPLVIGSSKYTNWRHKMKHSIAILHHNWKQLDKYIVYSYSFPLEVKHLLMFFFMAIHKVDGNLA